MRSLRKLSPTHHFHWSSHDDRDPLALAIAKDNLTEMDFGVSIRSVLDTKNGFSRKLIESTQAKQSKEDL
jgi:hypothetical protein